MEIQILKESGKDVALMGLGFSYELESEDIPVTGAYSQKTQARAEILGKLDGGHNKFLEQIQVWLCVRAPMYWWSQMDTYRLCSKSSKSKMHTLMSRPLLRSDFCSEVKPDTVRYLENLRQSDAFEDLIAELPMGYLQTRIINLSYKTIRNIIKQRSEHKLKEWSVFCEYLMKNLNDSKFLGI